MAVDTSGQPTFTAEKRLFIRLGEVAGLANVTVDFASSLLGWGHIILSRFCCPSNGVDRDAIG